MKFKHFLRWCESAKLASRKQVAGESRRGEMGRSFVTTGRLASLHKVELVTWYVQAHRPKARYEPPPRRPQTILVHIIATF